MCKSDTGVASRAFYNCPAGFEKTTFFSVFDHIEGGPILDATTGILELGFSENFAPGFGGEAVQADEWGVANCFTRAASVLSLNCRMAI